MAFSASRNAGGSYYNYELNVDHAAFVGSWGIGPPPSPCGLYGPPVAELVMEIG